MKVLGIIAEYNPFHFGHLYHLKRSQEIVEPAFTIAVMSGNFTQRGEAAILDKWARAEMAVKNGIDLVLELPTLYAVQAAELFAYGGIQVLNHTGLATHISFGSETGDLAPLEKIADILVSEDEAFKELLQGYLKMGLSFPAARYRAILKYSEEANSRDDETDEANSRAFSNKTLAGSNSILAIEYLKAIKRTGSSLIPVTIPRLNSSYNSPRLKKGISSATSIRREIFAHGLNERVKDAVPLPTYEILEQCFNQGKGPVDNNSLESLIMGTIRRSSPSEIRSWMDVSEGLENRIKESCIQSGSLAELLEILKTKRYVHTRLQRILIHGLLNIATESFESLNENEGPKYLRILAFSKNAGPLLKRLKETAKVPIITKAAHCSRYDKALQEMFALDCLATDIYSLGCPNPLHRKGDRDFTQGIYIE